MYAKNFNKHKINWRKMDKKTKLRLKNWTERSITMKLISEVKSINCNSKDRDKNKPWTDFIEQNLRKSKTKEHIKLKSKIRNSKISTKPSISKLQEWTNLSKTSKKISRLWMILSMKKKKDILASPKIQQLKLLTWFMIRTDSMMKLIISTQS